VRTRITANSCGGQPTHVSVLPGPDGAVTYLYQSDLWHTPFQRNQATARQFWAPLQFTDDGEILPVDCAATVPLPTGVRAESGDLVRLRCDVGAMAREAHVTLPEAKMLRRIVLPLFQKGSPSSPLSVELRAGTQVLWRETVEAGELGWDLRPIELRADVPLEAGTEYALRLTASPGEGCYGFATYRYSVAPPSFQLLTSEDGRAWGEEPGTALKVALGFGE
jgi:hypothetical protein